VQDWDTHTEQLSEEKVVQLMGTSAQGSVHPQKQEASLDFPASNGMDQNESLSAKSLWPDHIGKGDSVPEGEQEDPFNAPRQRRNTPSEIAAVVDAAPVMAPPPSNTMTFDSSPGNEPSRIAPAPALTPTGQMDVNGMPVPAPKKMLLGEKLISLGLISADQLKIALQEQKTSKKLIGAIMVEMGFLTESALAEAIAESSGVERFDLRKAALDPTVITLIPKELAVRHRVIPVMFENNTLKLAMADIYNVLAVDQVRRYIPRDAQVAPVYCTESEIYELINLHYDYETSIEGILKEIETGIRENNKFDGSDEGYVNPMVRLVNALLVDAIKKGTSDIHFEPEGSFLRLRYRIDGQMQQRCSLHRDYWPAINVRLKIMAAMNIAETRMPQDGRISFNVMGRDVDFRVATHPTIHGENIVMRILDKANSIVPLDRLGFTEHNITLLKKLIKRPEGIIIVTGPTGSGKTTTLYSVLNYINSIEVNIMTLEDPVEYQLPLIRQSNVKEGSISFSKGITSLMRQDPDIAFVGEVRDEETAMNAIRLALTGHQVYTTLHTNDALGSIPRLNDIGVPPHMLSGSLIAVLAQRLARKLCEKCKEPYKATPEDCKVLQVSPEDPPTIYRAKGCKDCNDRGYRGRTALIEILRVDSGLDELITTGATRNTMKEYALNKGFIPMIDDGVAKVLEGTIDIEELIGNIDCTERL
jgi:general secretion pathway protein E/type IV pilus assembly protein PilB